MPWTYDPRARTYMYAIQSSSLCSAVKIFKELSREKRKGYQNVDRITLAVPNFTTCVPVTPLRATILYFTLLFATRFKDIPQNSCANLHSNNVDALDVRL